MLKANVGSSTLADAKAAGYAAAKQAIYSLEDTKAAFVYASCVYDITELISGITEAMPDVPVFGNTSFTGTITQEGYISSEDGFVSVMALSDPELIVGVSAMERGSDPYVTGCNLAKAAMSAAGKDYSPSFFHMAASPAEEEFYLKGISSVIGRVPFFGGSAADNSIAGEWKLYDNTNLFADGALVAFFYTDTPMTNVYTGAYRETNDFGVITKVKNNRVLMEIDGVPTTEKYRQWTGVSEEAVTGDTLKALLAKMPTPPVAFHLVHCGGRRAGIGDRISEVVDQIKAAAGDIPFVVEFTFGEYGFESDNNNTCGGLMLSFTGFGA